MVDEARMEAQLVLHEGLELVPYLDTKGNETVGVGYNVTARGWDDWERLTGYQPTASRPATRDGAMAVLRADIARIQKSIPVAFPYWTQLSEVRQRVCVDLAFNMGYAALTFKACIRAIESNDWSRAAMELHKSKAQGQEPNRIDRLARMLLTNQDYTS